MDHRTRLIELGLAAAYQAKVQKDLNWYNSGRWRVIGISVAHNGDADVERIRRFLTGAPAMMQQLIDIHRLTDAADAKWGDEV